MSTELRSVILHVGALRLCVGLGSLSHQVGHHALLDFFKRHPVLLRLLKTARDAGLVVRRWWASCCGPGVRTRVRQGQYLKWYSRWHHRILLSQCQHSTFYDTGTAVFRNRTAVGSRDIRSATIGAHHTGVEKYWLLVNKFPNFKTVEDRRVFVLLRPVTFENCKQSLAPMNQDIQYTGRRRRGEPFPFQFQLGTRGKTIVALWAIGLIAAVFFNGAPVSEQSQRLYNDGMLKAELMRDMQLEEDFRNAKALFHDSKTWSWWFGFDSRQNVVVEQRRWVLSLYPCEGVGSGSELGELKTQTASCRS